MSDAPIDPSLHDDEDSDLDWLSDGLRPDAPADSALWPTPAQEMASLPGFTLDDESVLVPLPPSANHDEPVDNASVGTEPAATRPSGRHIRLALPGARTTAAAGIVGGVLLTAAVISGGIGLPPPGDPGRTQEASAPHASSATPPVEIDATSVARLNKSMKAAKTRERRRAAALKRQQKRAAAPRRERERGARAPAPAETQQVSNPPTTVPSAPADPWAGVPGAVREFEPGPWNNGGATS